MVNHTTTTPRLTESNPAIISEQFKNRLRAELSSLVLEWNTATRRAELKSPTSLN